MQPYRIAGHLCRPLILALSCLVAQPLLAEETLRILTWPGYADSDLVQEFAERYGVKVDVSLVSSDDSLREKLSANRGGNYDVFAANTAEIQYYIEQQLVQPLQANDMPNTKRQLWRFRNLQSIPGITQGTATYAIPYTYAEMGLIYDRQQFPVPPDSLASLWDPQYRGRVLAYDGSPTAQKSLQMIADSPVLRSAESDITAAEKQYESAKSTFYPRFDAELGRTADNDLDGQNGHNNEWQAMLRMRFNLYSGGSNKADLESKSYLSNQALDIRNNALRQLNEELGLAWNAYNNASQQVPIAQQYVDRSTKVRTSYQQQFSLGERTLLDLLDSENELFTAARRLEEVRFTELFTQYRIKATMGSLLKSQGVVAPMAAAPLDEVKAQVNLPGLN